MNKHLHKIIISVVLFSSCLSESVAPLGEYETFIRYFGNQFDEVAVQVKELPDAHIALLSNTAIASNEFKITLTLTDKFGHKKWDYRGPANGNFRASSFITRNNGNFLITGDEIINGVSYLMLLEISTSGTEVNKITFNPQPIEIKALSSVKGTGMTWGANNNLLIISSVSNNGSENMLLQSISADWSVEWSRAYGSDDGSWLSPSGASSITKRLYNNGNDVLIWSGTKTGNNQADLRLTAAQKNAQNPEFDLSFGTPERNEEAFDMCRYPVDYSNPQLNLGYAVVGLAGADGGTSDIKLVRTATNGALIFEKTFGTDRNDFGKAVTATRDGSLLVFATTQTLAGNTSYYLIKLNSFGDIIWEQQIGSTHNEDAIDVVESMDGSIIVCGTTNFGGQKMAMLMKLDKEGRIF
jgi:hypothetical protein